MKIKALSLWQPWASLIAVGAKRYETRSWPTKYRGPLLICASKWGQRPSFDRTEILGLLQRPEFFEALFHLVPKYGERMRSINHLWARSIYDVLPFGQAVAIVDLSEVILCTEDGFGLRITPTENLGLDTIFGDFSHGRYAWKLENVRAIKPFYIQGKQGLFEVEVSEEQLRELTI